MISKEAVKYSLNNLKQRKTRSIFTIISIFIGIATIFIFVSFGLGLYNYIEEITTSSSADKVIIQPKGGMGIPGTDDTFAFKEDELKAIEQTSGVYEASGSIFKSTEVIQGKKRIYTFLVSYDPKKPLIMEVSNIDILSGRGLKSGDSGVVLGYAFMKENLVFPKAYSIGDLIEIQRKKLKVLGFFEEVGTINDDSQIYVTNDFLKDLYEKEFNYTWIVAKVDRSNIEQVVRNIEKTLRKERDIEEGKENFDVESFEDMLETYKMILNMVIGFVILIALISVLVSGVNTTNTMISSVLERTKEIGIMKSIGARNSHILGIFLFESSFLGFVAGILGCLVGFITSFVGGVILDNIGYGFLHPAFPLILFVGCILFAVLTGVVSGIAPAYNAMKINPVKALRYE